MNTSSSATPPSRADGGQAGGHVGIGDVAEDVHAHDEVEGALVLTHHPIQPGERAEAQVASGAEALDGVGTRIDPDVGSHAAASSASTGCHGPSPHPTSSTERTGRASRYSAAATANPTLRRSTVREPNPWSRYQWLK